ncbi:hypothetical protein ACFYVL_02200 [Streptomyces sp. NPDC004111]|uniref:hypothetical protein n=1 Tax=Streptomyces sp. NPDC004111 TaxID=3364690 RepID=UPI003684E720
MESYAQESYAVGSYAADFGPQAMVVRAGRAGETLVLHTPPGGARYVATLIDADPGLDVMGCVAGNDVVLVVCRGRDGVRGVLRHFHVEAES